MDGLLGSSILQSLLYPYQDSYKDPAGFPVDINRPIVFDPNKYEPHTELTETFKASELGLPGDGYYNVPTIYDGKIFDSEKDFDQIKKNVQQLQKQGFQLPFFSDLNEAKTQAQARSTYIGKIRNQELQDTIAKQRQNYLTSLLGM